MPFTFKQRAKKLNWLVLSSLDIEHVVSNVRITDLQAIIDEVTFSSLDSKDIKFIDFSNFSKLVYVLQLIVEYLLHCQESQSKLIQKLSLKFKQSSGEKNSLLKDYACMKEKLQGYKNQIEHLKKLAFDEDYKKLHTENQRNQQNASNDQQGSATSVHMISSILSSEKQTRDHILSVIEDQKSTFVQELSKIMQLYMERDNRIEILSASAYQVQLSESMNNMFGKMENLMNDRLSQVMKNIQPTKMTTRRRRYYYDDSDDDDDENEVNDSGTNNVYLDEYEYDELRRQKRWKKRRKQRLESALQINKLKNDLDQKDIEIQKLSLLIIEKELYWEREKQEFLSVQMLQASNLDSYKYTFQHAKIVGVRQMKLILSQAFRRMVSKGFSSWKALMYQHREDVYTEEYSRRLQVGHVVNTRKIEEIKTMYEIEKDKVQIEQAKYNVLERKYNELITQYERMTQDVNTKAMLELMKLKNRMDQSVQTDPPIELPPARPPVIIQSTYPTSEQSSFHSAWKDDRHEQWNDDDVDDYDDRYEKAESNNNRLYHPNLDQLTQFSNSFIERYDHEELDDDHDIIPLIDSDSEKNTSGIQPVVEEIPLPPVIDTAAVAALEEAQRLEVLRQQAALASALMTSTIDKIESGLVKKDANELADKLASELSNRMQQKPSSSNTVI